MGYAYETRALAALLPPDYEVLGVDLHPNPRDNGEVFPGDLVTDKAIAELCADTGRQVSVVNNTSPEGYAYFPGAVNIGLFSWETDAIAYGLNWPELIAAMDFNWAKTTYQQAFLKRCGWMDPVPLIAWPFDFDLQPASQPERLAHVSLSYIDRYSEAPRAMAAAAVAEVGAPLWLSVSSMAPRKGLPILLSEWRDHVDGGGEGLLMLKLRPIHNHRLDGQGAPDMSEWLAHAGFRAGDRVRIAYTFEDLDVADLRELYRLSDGYVTAAYGEGFGGPVVEALILERPVIAPRHSSFADLLPAGYPLQVETTLRHVGLAGNSLIYPHASSWGLPDRGSLVRALGRFTGMSAETRRRVMEEARRHAQAFCGRPAVAAALLGFFDGLEVG